MTVSNALNAPAKLRPGTLARVMKAVDDLGYRPSLSARGLRVGSSGLIGFCVTPRSDNRIDTFMDEFLVALCFEIERVGRHVLLFTSSDDRGDFSAYEHLIASTAVDGFVLTNLVFDDPRPRWLTGQGIPAVSFGRTGHEDLATPWVDVDNAAGVEQVVDHLGSLGHHRIGFLQWPNPSGTEDRLRGWRAACERRGLPFGEELVGHSRLDRGGALILDVELLDAGVTALIAENDGIALHAMDVLVRRGLRPGTDVAIVGYDDRPSASVIRPALSSVRQPVEDVARRIVELLCCDAAPSTVGEALAPQLIVRASSDPEQAWASARIAARRPDGLPKSSPLPHKPTTPD